MRKTAKLTMITVSLICLLSLMAPPLYAFDKAEMDVALREELAKIPDVETRQAILDEYKEVIRAKMPELDLDEATCQQCEEDLKVLEKEFIATDGVNTVDKNIALKDREPNTTPETPTTTPDTTYEPPDEPDEPPEPPDEPDEPETAPPPPPKPCGC